MVAFHKYVDNCDNTTATNEICNEIPAVQQEKLIISVFRNIVENTHFHIANIEMICCLSSTYRINCATIQTFNSSSAKQPME